MDPYSLWTELQQYLREGGFVMGPLLACACALWYGLGERMLILGRRFGGDIPARVRGGDTPKSGIMAEAWRVLRSNAQLHLSEPDQRARFDEALFGVRTSLQKYRVMVKSVVIIAPLAGLLGTVSGMIETFDSLGNQALFAATGGVAGGISQALLTTQMGLVVAIPGVIVGRILDRRQRQIEDDLDQLIHAATSMRGELTC